MITTSDSAQSRAKRCLKRGKFVTLLFKLFYKYAKKIRKTEKIRNSTARIVYDRYHSVHVGMHSFHLSP